MKQDLDALMQDQEIEALLISGPADHNPAMVYFTGIKNIGSATLLKKRGAEPVLYHYAMERDEAARTGLVTRDIEDLGFTRLLRANRGDAALAMGTCLRDMLADQGVHAGRVAVMGLIDAGASWATLNALQASAPEISLVGAMGRSVLNQAMATKDGIEVERVRSMGKKTVEVVGRTAEFLSAHKAREERLVKADGQPLTIGEVKRQINLWLAELEAENPEGTIFALGYDAAIPHSAGTDSDPLWLGKTLIFDIFPCEQGGGYYYDFTRTWCLGYAPDQVQALFEDVRYVYEYVVAELHANMPCFLYQQLACFLFETRGHPTVWREPRTQSGYVHSLGHGVGLNIHEQPAFRIVNDGSRLLPGSVVTIEPGLYYPERAMAVRLEDTYWVRTDEQVQVLADFPLDLVLPVKA
jgi:Xaa-Pro aminopeptidase